MFVNLHNHSYWSLLDGMSKPQEMVARAKELGQPAIAITDHGTMAGVIDFFLAAKEADIKPIIGVEVYVCQDVNVRDQHEIYGHFLLLAKNLDGYHNLLKLVSEASDYFYRKPRVDINLLAKYSSGVIAMSACRAGYIPTAILSGDMDKAAELAIQYKDIYSDFFLELQYAESQEQKAINEGLIALSKLLSIPLVVTTDSHYISKKDTYAHEVLLAIQTKKLMSDPTRFKFDEPNYWIKSEEEIRAYNPPDEAIKNTAYIADMCNVEIPLYQNLLPKLKLNTTDDEYLRSLAYDGLFNKYADGKISDLAVYKERLNFELDVISKKKLSSYFLIVWDLIKAAKQKGIAVGPARGSAGGSLLSYVIGITQIDPIKHGLLFHRFISLDRPTMPDIDIDIPTEAQAELMHYLDEKYGYTCRVGAYQTMASKGVLKSIGRALDLPYAEMNTITALIPVDMGHPWPIEKAIEIPELKSWVEKYPQLFELALKLEDLPSARTMHAAGYIVSPVPITDNIPLHHHSSGQKISEFNMESLEHIGSLKLDLLALKNISIINDTIKDKGISIDDLYAMEFDDPNVFKTFTNGDTLGVFQCASSGMTSIFENILPEKMTFSVLADIISIYRPGPLAFKDTYIKRVNGYEYPTYDIPELEPILKDTFGIILYQEQCMRIGTDLAGYSQAQSDALRKAIAKKKGLEQELKRLVYGADDIPGLVKNGIPEDKALKLAEDMKEFGNYAFNKSHAVGYAVLAYITAYLKTYMTKEFLAASMSHESDPDTLIQFVFDCHKHHIQVLPPDINKSQRQFTVEGDAIRFGLSAVKGLGNAAIDAILDARPFESLEDMLSKLAPKDVNKTRLYSLIYSCALDCFGKRQDIAVRINEIRKTNIKIETNLAQAEQNTLGTYFLYHPLKGIAEQIDWSSLYPEQTINTACIIKDVRKHITRNNKDMFFVRAEMLDGTHELVAFDDFKLKPGWIYDVTLKYRFSRGYKSYVIQNALPNQQVS